MSVALGITKIDERTILRARDFDRIWGLVDKSAGPDACWPWKGNRDPEGYGHICLAGIGSRSAHRIVLSMSLNRPLLPQEFALHRCDNPPCCNPAHLWAGSTQENTADCVAKNRTAFGERQHKAKLTTPQVSSIKRRLSEGAARTVLAREYGVSVNTIRDVASGRTWRRVGSEERHRGARIRGQEVA